MAHRRVSIPEKVKLFVWAKSAGRCEICNTPVYEDPLTFEEVNIGDHAHIIGSSPKGPRGDKNLSAELANDPTNIMLLCKAHHKKIDTEEFIADYPPEVLRDLKRRHEERIEFVTSVGEENKSHVLLYGANIGANNNPVDFKQASIAMLPEKYPAERHPIKIHVVGSSLTDDKASFWIAERENLHSHFNTLVRGRIERSEILHLSVFALAPIPLLVELGTLLTDKARVEVHQLLREPQGWKWQPHKDEQFGFTIIPPESTRNKNVGIILSLSGTIPIRDVTDAMSDEVDIWMVTIPTVSNDFLKSKEQLSIFRQAFRKLLNDIKSKHGRDALIHLFPAVPVSIAIEIGRVWMPKADLPIVIYDRNRAPGLGFSRAFQIG